MDDEARVVALLDELLAEHDPKSEPIEEFLGAQFDAGLAFVHFPEGHGGLGLAPRLQAVVNRRLLAAGAPFGGDAQRHRLRHGRADDRHPRHRGTEGAIPPSAVHGRGDVVPALQRAGCRIRRRRSVDPCRARRRRMDRERSEGLDVARALREVGTARRAHRPRCREAQGPDLLRARHAPARCGSAAVATDDRQRRVQRGVLHQRPRAGREPARRRRQGLVDRRHHAHERACVHRRRDRAAGRGHDPDRHPALEGRRPQRARDCATG